MKEAFFISFFAGVSTMFGTLVLLVKNANKAKVIGCSLAFSSGVMIAVSLLDLIPSSIVGLNKKVELLPSILISTIFIVLGIILSTILNKFICKSEVRKGKNLYRVGILSMITIILHNVPEGMATFLTTNENIELGIYLAIAIAFHNIPEGISISVPICFSTGSKSKALLYTFISGISEFFGAVIAFLFLSSFTSNLFLYLLYSLISGVMLNLVLEELLPNSYLYQKKLNIIFYMLLGMLLMFVFHFFS